tara:strand:+ start:1122 stop:1871 length:750 start_codon:yes stop_codon:yes gene_type:complete
MQKKGINVLEHSNSYTFRFVIIITIVASFVLAFTSQFLKSKQEANIEIDRKKNILECLGLNLKNYSNDKIVSVYDEKINFILTDINGKKYQDISESDLYVEENKSTGMLSYFINDREYLPLYYSKSPEAYILPISGKGLWSTLFGYIALEADLNTIKGITFYKHKETAGLGGEVEKKWFRDNFIGKKIFDINGNLISIKVVKGKAKDVLSENKWMHAVDGISGATITSNGVSSFLKNDLIRYSKFLNNN